MLIRNKNESCPDRKTAIKLFVHNQIITPLYYNNCTATAFVTRKSVQNFKIPYRLEVINDLSFFENHNKVPFSPPTKGFYILLTQGKYWKTQG
jgi:hypothetical protein